MDFIAAYQQERGYSPSYEEMADGLELASVATVHKHVSALESKQYLRRAANMSRSLEITAKWTREQDTRNGKPLPPAVEVPLMGRIAAGTPVESVSGYETLNFSDFANDSGTYALQVRGESMIEDHICDGDFVLIQKFPKYYSRLLHQPLRLKYSALMTVLLRLSLCIRYCYQCNIPRFLMQPM